MTPRDYREHEQIYAGELERGVDGDVLAEIGFRPLESASEFTADMPTEDAASEVVETGAADESASLPETEDTAVVADDEAWQHEAYAEYLAGQEREGSPRPQVPHTAKAGRRRGASRRLTGRAALFADGRGIDPDLM